MSVILELIRQRRSSRTAFDPDRPVPARDLRLILEAARWAPTPHNMQNFEVIAVDDRAMLEAIAAIRAQPSETFLRENRAQLAFSESAILQRKAGLLAGLFPETWQRERASEDPEVGDPQHSFLGTGFESCPMLLIVVYDSRQKAPDSPGDFLGAMALGCVMQNMWLVADSLGIGVQMLSVFGGQKTESELQRILQVPDHMRIAFGCRVGYPTAGARYLRVRREAGDFVHRNRYGNRGLG